MEMEIMEQGNQEMQESAEHHAHDRTKEETAVVLDFLPNGYSYDSRPMFMKNPAAQAIGKSHFILLELVPKKGIHLQPFEEVYIGDGKRDKIHHIMGKISTDKLTATARSELEFVIKDIISKNEKKFIDFFNRARPLGTRMHQLELLPGLGKKHMWQIIEARDEKPFDSFADLKNRVKLLPDPEKAVIKRILLELQGAEKHKLFVDT
jgi:putative nucleotide binding protein